MSLHKCRFKSATQPQHGYYTMGSSNCGKQVDLGKRTQVLTMEGEGRGAGLFRGVSHRSFANYFMFTYSTLHMELIKSYSISSCLGEDARELPVLDHDRVKMSYDTKRILTIYQTAKPEYRPSPFKQHGFPPLPSPPSHVM